MQQDKMIALKEKENQQREELIRRISADTQDNLWGKEYTPSDILAYLEDELYLEITPPYVKESKLQWLKTTVNHNGVYQVDSYKAGNIFINMKSALLNTTPVMIEMAIATDSFRAEQTGISLLAVVAALISILGMSKKSFSEIAALIIITVWENRVDDKKCCVDEVYSALNDKLLRANKDIISKEKYNQILDDLIKYKCIDIIDERIIILERITVKYN